MNAPDFEYYNQSREDLLALLPQGIRFLNVLDVGCGVGAAGHLLKEKFAAEKVTGIEKAHDIALQAQKRLDEVLVMDAESPDVPFQPNQFDLIIMGDVLEHLCDPWTMIDRYHHFLKTDGLLLLSVPNVQYWRTSISLLLGNWDYRDYGILDRSHVHFFTIRSIKKMVKDMQVKTLKIKYGMGRKSKILNFLTCRLLKGLLTYQIFLLLQNRGGDFSKKY